MLILLAVFIVGGAVFVSENKEKNKPVFQGSDTNSGLSYTAGLSATSSVAYIENTTDTDGDGLKDWEEVLWGAKVNLADTDGDGTSDGKEVDLGRNPTKKGPDDKVILVASSTTGSNQPLTTTDTLARGIFSKYMTLRQVGLSSDPESQTEGINDVLRESLQNFNPPVYVERQIKVSTDTSPLALRNYGNAVGGAFKFNSINSRSETLVVKESIERESPQILLELDPTIASYKKMLNTLLLIPAPQNHRDLHLAIVNGIATLIYIDENFKKVFTDPVLSLQALGYYEPTVTLLTNSLSALRTTLISQNISYTAEEGGSFLIEP